MSTDIYESTKVDKGRPSIPHHRKRSYKVSVEKKRRKRSNNKGLRRLIHLSKKDSSKNYISWFLFALVILFLLIALYMQFFNSFSVD